MKQLERQLGHKIQQAGCYMENAIILNGMRINQHKAEHYIWGSVNNQIYRQLRSQIIHQTYQYSTQ